MSLSTVLIGAGGHAKVVFDVLSANGENVAGFVDPAIDIFYEIKKLSDADLDWDRFSLAVSLGGVSPNQLLDRFNLLHRYQSSGATFINIISNAAYLSKKAAIGEGVFINHGAVIHASSKIADFVIVNTSAIIEHDVVVEDGAHIAPGAVVLGGCHIGKCSMIGAGAVILPGSKIPDNYLVPALTRYSGK